MGSTAIDDDDDDDDGCCDGYAVGVAVDVMGGCRVALVTSATAEVVAVLLAVVLAVVAAAVEVVLVAGIGSVDPFLVSSEALPLPLPLPPLLVLLSLLLLLACVLIVGAVTWKESGSIRGCKN